MRRPLTSKEFSPRTSTVSICYHFFSSTGSPETAENCFVEGVGEAVKGNYVFKEERARSWARRTIIQSAIRLTAPLHYARPDGWSTHVARGLDRVPMILHAEVRAILDLSRTS